MVRESGPRREFIRRDDEKYTRARDTEHNITRKRQGIFGENEYFALQGGSPEVLNQLRDKLQKALNLNIEHPVGLANAKKRLESFIEPFFNSAYAQDVSNTRDEFLRQIQVEAVDSVEQDERNIYKNLLQKNPEMIPDDILEAMLNAYVEHTWEKQAEEKDFVEESKEKFLIAVEKAIEDGWLPISIEEVKKRLDDHMVINPDLFQSDIMTGGSASEFSVEISHIDLTRPNWSTKVIFHEFVHAISGISLSAEIDPEHDDRNDPLFAYSNKMGLHFKRPGTEDFRFEWLNEATTEYIARRLFGETEEEFIAYNKEVNLLTELMAEDKELEALVMAAYLEDFNPQDKRSGPTAFTRMVKKIHQLRGKGFIIKANKLLAEIE